MSNPVATAVRAVLAVLSGFVGIRRGQRAAQDAKNIHPVHLLIAGVALVAAFVGILLLVVQSVVNA